MITADQFIDAWTVGTIMAVVLFVIFIIALWIYRKITP